MKLEMDRRNFLKTAGGVTLAVSASLLTGCGGSDGGATAPGGSSNSGSGNGGGTSGGGSTENPGSGSETGSGSQTSDKVIWVIHSYGDGTAYLIDYDKNGKRPSGDIVIPDHDDDGNTVIRISDFALTGYNGTNSAIPEVTSVTIPASIKEIAQYAFATAENLKAVSIKGCVTLGEYVFYKCPQLESVELPNTIQKIGRAVFSGCSKLKNVTLPESLTSVGDNAFYNTGIESIVIPGTFAMEGAIFADCVKLKKVVIEPGVTRLMDFSGCTALEEVTLMDTPNRSLEIRERCFYNCTALRKIYLPKWVTVGYNAFGCDNNKGVQSNLTDIYYGGSEAEWKECAQRFGEENQCLTKESVRVHYNAKASDL